MDRKNFLKASAVLAATAIYANATATPLFSQRIRVGVIGINGMGWSNLQALLKLDQVECTAICDIDENVLEKRRSELADRHIIVKTYVDYQDLLQDNKVDAVIIATPDHWHCLQMIDALQAGKHVYVEKPIGNSIKECESMVAAAAQSSCVVQVGQWQRSQQHFKEAIDFVHSGKLGKVRLAKAWSYVGWKKTIQVKPDSPIPVGVHYDRWLGPAPKRPFNANRFHFEFRWFWDYAGGLMTDWGVHLLDYALAGMKANYPKSVVASGGTFAGTDGAAETPDTMTAIYEFDDFNIQWEHAIGIGAGLYNRDHGIAFIGNNGTLILNRNGWEVVPEQHKMEAVPLQKAVDKGLEKHMENFVDAIRKKDKSIVHAPIDMGAHIAIFSQMGNIAYRTGKKLYWDHENTCFTDEEANRYLTVRYHNGYMLPDKFKV